MRVVGKGGGGGSSGAVAAGSDGPSVCRCSRARAKPMPRLESCAWSCSCAARGRQNAQLGDTAAGLAAKVGEMLSSSVSGPSLTLVGPGARSPSTASTSATSTTAGSSTLNLSQHLVQRSVVLFVVGAFMALVLNLLQIQRNVTLFPDEVISTLFSSAWWVPPCCGTAAGESLTSASGVVWGFFPPPWGGGGGGAECLTCACGSLVLPSRSVRSELSLWEACLPAPASSTGRSRPRPSRVSEGFLGVFELVHSQRG